MTRDVNKDLPPTPGACAHAHMRFRDGTFILQCIDCDQQWGAMKDGMLDYRLKAYPIYPPRDTRHDRWEVSRTEPVKKSEPCPSCGKMPPDMKCPQRCGDYH